VNASEQAAIVDRTKARLEAIRCVEFTESVPVTVISRTAFGELQRGGNVTAETTAELRAFDNAKFEALFLIGESEDSLEVQQRNRDVGVLGFYSPEADRIFLIAEDRGTLRIDETTLAHELVHAWQDQRYNLSAEKFAPRLRDEANARAGLVEGDASYVDGLYQQRCVAGDWNGTCLLPETGPADAGSLANVGVYFLEFQPYSDGPEFVRLARTVGGWDAVNDLYDRPPQSSEQVIHGEKYQQDEPTDPNLTDSTTGNWSRVRPQDRPEYGSVGEAGLMTMFVYPYYDSQGLESVLPRDSWLKFDEEGNVSAFDPYDYHRSNYTAGWDGDRLHVYRNETGQLGYVWRLTWDSPQDAREFIDGYLQVLDYWDGEQVDPATYRIPAGGFEDAFHVSVDGRNVTIVNAPTVGQLDDVRMDVGNETADGNQTLGG
jgi:hypothetical protein